MSKYYALYDLQLSGFKAGMASEDYDEVVKMGADRARWLSQSDLEPIEDSMSDEDVLANYDYEVREVSEKDFETILYSKEIGLLTTVDLSKKSDEE